MFTWVFCIGINQSRPLNYFNLLVFYRLLGLSLRNNVSLKKNIYFFKCARVYLLFEFLYLILF